MPGLQTDAVAVARRGATATMEGQPTYVTKQEHEQGKLVSDPPESIGRREWQ